MFSVIASLRKRNLVALFKLCLQIDMYRYILIFILSIRQVPIQKLNISMNPYQIVGEGSDGFLYCFELKLCYQNNGGPDGTPRY